MKFVVFTHSLLSDWNHGNAHFLRGVVTELIERGHAVDVLEPREAWSVQNLIAEAGEAALERAKAVYPRIHPIRYDASLDVAKACAGADVVLVHEWNEPALVKAVGDLRKAGAPFLALFHDTHHRAASAPQDIGRFDLSGYDAVLAFGGVIRDLYLKNGWARRAFTWHEAADARVFRPLRAPGEERAWDLVWVGNWGDEERTAELHEFLLGPVKRLGLKALVHGVRYPEHARAALKDAGIQYGGWIANFDVPALFASARVTVHVPRRPYVEALPGIPTIRPFEAMACGIPLVSAPWNDSEELFHPGHDFLVARDGVEMEQHLKALVSSQELRGRLALAGRAAVLSRHTCAHRVTELLGICDELRSTTSVIHDQRASA